MKTLVFVPFILIFSLVANSQDLVHQSVGLKGIYAQSISNQLTYKLRLNLYESIDWSLGVSTTPGLGLEFNRQDGAQKMAYSAPLSLEFIKGLTSTNMNLKYTGWSGRFSFVPTNVGTAYPEAFSLDPSLNVGVGFSYIFQTEDLRTFTLDLNGIMPIAEDGVMYDWGTTLGLRYMMGLY